MTVVRQRADSDCGIGALASLTGIAYEDVYLAASKVDRQHNGKQGLYQYEVIAIARRLKPAVRLRATTRFDLDVDAGVLRVYFRGPKAKTSPGGHFVAVKHGRIGCPGDGDEQPWRVWLKANQVRRSVLLKASTLPISLLRE